MNSVILINVHLFLRYLPETPFVQTDIQLISLDKNAHTILTSADILYLNYRLLFQVAAYRIIRSHFSSLFL